MVKISIIVPVYNVEKYLSKCLDSLICQTIDSYEIIIINDGSTDNSQLLIDNYQRSYPKLIRSYIKSNAGIGAARNDGLNYAVGEFIGFVDSDDWVSENMFELMYEKAQSDKSDIVCCGYKEIFSDSEKDVLPRFTGYSNCRYKVSVVPWNKIYRLEFIKSNHLSFMTQVFHEDYDFTIRIFSLTNNISFLDNYCYYYNRTNALSITSLHNIHSESYLLVLRNLFKWMRDKNIQDRQFHEYVLIGVYDYVNMYQKDYKRVRHFIRDDFFNIISISKNKINACVKLLLLLLGVRKTL